jgi:hypothetical protein
MKTYKSTIVWMTLFVIISLAVAIIIEFKEIGGYKHYTFYENIVLGVFASSLISLVISIISFKYEKRKFYIRFYQEANILLFKAQELIRYMKIYSGQVNMEIKI